MSDDLPLQTFILSKFDGLSQAIIMAPGKVLGRAEPISPVGIVPRSMLAYLQTIPIKVEYNTRHCGEACSITSNQRGKKPATSGQSHFLDPRIVLGIFFSGTTVAVTVQVRRHLTGIMTGLKSKNVFLYTGRPSLLAVYVDRM